MAGNTQRVITVYYKFYVSKFEVLIKSKDKIIYE